MLPIRRTTKVTNFIDITLTLRPGMPVWPNTDTLRVVPSLRIRTGDEYNVSRIECDLHMGTHVDAPWHCLEDGDTVDQLPLGVLIGPALVAHLPDCGVITPTDLEKLELPLTIRRLLLRTDNSELWRGGDTEFHRDYVGLNLEAAQWVAQRGIRLLGMDYLSVEPYHKGPAAHRVLLGANVVLLEGLNLMDVEPGLYELICLPIKLEGADGAPARAVLRTLNSIGRAPSAAGGYA
jgi:arylformamidase